MRWCLKYSDACSFMLHSFSSLSFTCQSFWSFSSNCAVGFVPSILAPLLWPQRGPFILSLRRMYDYSFFDCWIIGVFPRWTARREGYFAIALIRYFTWASSLITPCKLRCYSLGFDRKKRFKGDNESWGERLLMARFISTKSLFACPKMSKSSPILAGKSLFQLKSIF